MQPRPELPQLPIKPFIKPFLIALAYLSVSVFLTVLCTCIALWELSYLLYGELSSGEKVWSVFMLGVHSVASYLNCSMIRPWFKNTVVALMRLREMRRMNRKFKKFSEDMDRVYADSNKKDRRDTDGR
jgi:hypothetical protein